MTFDVRVSADYVVDLDEGESSPAGFVHGPSWPTGRFSCRTPMVRLRAPSSSELTQIFESTLIDIARRYASDFEVAQLRRAARGYLSLRITFSPEQGFVRMPAEFIRIWGELGGRVELDIPLSP